MAKAVTKSEIVSKIAETVGLSRGQVIDTLDASTGLV